MNFIEHGHIKHDVNQGDHKMNLMIDNLIIMSLSVIMLIINSVYGIINFSSLSGPILYFSTGFFGLSYIRSREDTTLIIYEIFIYAEFFFNTVVMFYLTFLLIGSFFLSESLKCEEKDEICLSLDDSLWTAKYILIVSDFACVGVLVLMYFTLLHFKRFNKERQGNDYIRHY